MDNVTELKKLLEYMCLTIDELAKEQLTPGTPEYEYQQSSIAAVKRYRDKK